MDAIIPFKKDMAQGEGIIRSPVHSASNFCLSAGNRNIALRQSGIRLLD